MIEYRDLTELSGEGDGSTISGWACRFNEAADLGAFKETVKRGAFARTLTAQVGKIRLLAGHDSGALPVGSITRLEERADGLWLEASIADTTVGRDVKALAAGGHPIGLSIGFSVPSGGDSWSQDGRERTLTEARLHEISLVGAPAYDNADVVGIRSLDALLAATASLQAGNALSDGSAERLKRAVSTIVDLLRASGTDVSEMFGQSAPAAPAELAAPAADLSDLDSLASKAGAVLDGLLPTI